MSLHEKGEYTSGVMQKTQRARTGADTQKHSGLESAWQQPRLRISYPRPLTVTGFTPPRTCGETLGVMITYWWVEAVGILAINLKAGGTEKLPCWTCASLLAQLPSKYPDAFPAVARYLFREGRRSKTSSRSESNDENGSLSSCRQASWERRRE